MNIPILFEDESLLIIGKPAGIVVNKAESVKGETIQDWMENNFKFQISNFKLDRTNEKTKDFVDRSGIVHRLDKETSGCLIIGKTPEVFYKLQQQFKERFVKKTYLALVHGKLVPERGEIHVPVGRLPWNRERFGVVPGGKEAITRYNVVKHDTNLSLVEFYPETGRTHQIRVHCKYINHPIVGDYLYAGRKTARLDRMWAPRVMLHAWKLRFVHPVTGKVIAIEAPIPDDMKRYVL